MRALRWFVAVSLLALVTASPVAARVVRIETAVTLADRSEASVEQALRQALDTSVRGALAMGLVRMWVDDARVLSNAVVLAMVATDEELDDEDDDRGTDRET